MNIQIRMQKMSDAGRFFEILSNPNFRYLPAKPATLDEEKEFLRQNSAKRKKKREYNFSILHDGILVGAIGVRIDQFRPYIGEVGYFVDEAYWGKGIATAALNQLERFIANETTMSRIEIRMSTENAASERVAQKCGYSKEGVLNHMLIIDDHWLDCYLYAKILMPSSV